MDEFKKFTIKFLPEEFKGKKLKICQELALSTLWWEIWDMHRSCKERKNSNLFKRGKSANLYLKNTLPMIKIEAPVFLKVPPFLSFMIILNNHLIMKVRMLSSGHILMKKTWLSFQILATSQMALSMSHTKKGITLTLPICHTVWSNLTNTDRFLSQEWHQLHHRKEVGKEDLDWTGTTIS